jgi:hypothetical protein
MSRKKYRKRPIDKKKKFSSKLTSKTQTAQVNEILARVLAYNLTVVIRVLSELEVEPNFKK